MCSAAVALDEVACTAIGGAKPHDVGREGGREVGLVGVRPRTWGSWL